MQEFGIKAHMLNTYEAYRLAARGPNGELPANIDNKSAFDLFLEPVRTENLTSPWVYIPIAFMFTYTTIDYLVQLRNLSGASRVTPSSNFMYSVNYSLWQPVGSGAPEEMFYRGFLQNEFKTWVPSPFFAVPLSAALFAFFTRVMDGSLLR